PDGASYTLGQSVVANYSCADESGGSGVASCAGAVDGTPVADGAALPTDTAGTHTFVVSAADNARNTSSETHTYTVLDVVTRDGRTLLLHGAPYRPIGLNIYNANSNGWCSYAMDGSVLDDSLTAIGAGKNAGRAWFFQQLATTNGARDWTAL